tara:strand:- start:493 stop:951 length:459 start_codon:yes stop_codon:yes gene_type:complete
VGIMVLNGAGLVLVCQRKDQSGDTWQMPQGGIDNGESPRAAALRELEEEIGTADVEIIGEIQGWIDYDLPADLVGRVWKGQYRGQTQKWFAVRLLADEGTINLGDDRHAEFDTWRWIEPERLPEVIVPFKRGVYEAVVKEFQPLTERLRISG